jgi:hypothetical protein
MTHPITPPPEMVQQWYNQADKLNEPFITYIATRAAQYGAKQQLEACCEWVKSKQTYWAHDELRAARRPKPPSLKEQLLNDFDWLMNAKGVWTNSETQLELLNRTERIRLALEQLDD